MDKPPYRVPTMDEIRAIPWNGLNVASTFSGCGGSSLGYRMAGFRVVWASEFVPAARDSYNANKSPDTIVDPRDIRIVNGSDILSAIAMGAGELDLLDGSPPCASFSSAGTREAGWSKVKSYSDKAQRTDDLFFEFARILKEVQPRVFVAENVSGLVKGTAKGYFLEILDRLKRTGYHVSAKLLDAQWLGVPQVRQRLIFVGVRADLRLGPVFPKPLAYSYSLIEILPHLRAIAVDRRTSKYGKNAGAIHQPDLRQPCDTITAHGVSADDSVDWKVEADTDMSRFAVGREWEKLKPGEATYYGMGLCRPDVNRPCPTVIQRGGDPSTASVAHPIEKRKFSIAELRRICAFPDDFILTGSFAQQWERLGRAVPPVMMKAIAETIRDGVLLPLRSQEHR